LFDPLPTYRGYPSLAKVFISTKMRERLFFLGSDYAQLHELVVDKTILPQCLGGAQADDAGGWVKQQVEAMLAEQAAAEVGAPAGAK